MVSTTVIGDIIRILCGLSDTLVCISFMEPRCWRKPWVVAFLTVFVTVFYLRTSTDVVGGLWMYPLYHLSPAIETLSRYEYSLRRPTLRYPLQELVHISAVLLSMGISLLQACLGWNLLALPLLQLSYSVLRLSLTLCLVQVASIETQVLRRSVEVSYDWEAQDTVGWGRLKNPWINLEFRTPFEAAQTSVRQSRAAGLRPMGRAGRLLRPGLRYRPAWLAPKPITV
jgi:hypothetical protein